MLIELKPSFSTLVLLRSCHSTAIRRYRIQTCLHKFVLKRGMSSLPNLEPEDDLTRRERFRIRVFNRFFSYLKNYDAVLEKVLPSIAFKAYKTFSVGSRLLFQDMKEFAGIYSNLSSTRDWEAACKMLSRRQLELYLTLPSELRRVAPVLLISALPFAQNVVFPLALMYPKKLLSSHFWNEDIRTEFGQERIVRRRAYFLPTFNKLVGWRQNVASPPHPHLAPDDGQPKRDAATDCIKVVIAGSHPPIEKILEMLPLFRTDGRFSLSKLSTPHLISLGRMYDDVGYFLWIYPLDKLTRYGNMLLQIDQALEREGIDNLGITDVSACCRMRGLDTENKDLNQMKVYLNGWLTVSKHLDEKSTSLLLHLPLFLCYEHKGRLSKIFTTKRHGRADS